MKIKVASQTVTVLEPEDLGRFEVVTALTESALGDALTSSGWGTASDQPGHAYISVQAIRNGIGAAATKEWESRFQGMLAYAASKGWMNADEIMILGHIEPDE